MPEPIGYRRTFTLRLPDEILDKVHYTAKYNKRSVNSEIEFIILRHIEAFEKEKGIISQPEVKEDE